MTGPPIVGPASGAKNSVLAFARERGADRFDEVEAFVAELFRLGKRANYDAFMIAVQSAVETGDWSSSWWRERLNPGGIGIIGDPVHDAGSRTWANGRDAARAMLVHHAAYLGGEVPDALRPFLDLDPRFQAAVERVQQVGPVVHWDDYGSGNWAEDPEYFKAILARAQAVRAVVVPPNGGRRGEESTMPQPTAVLDKFIEGHRFEGRFDAGAGVQGAPRYIVLHIQEGNNHGTWNFFADPNVEASATVLIGKDGEVWKVIPEGDGPWTNGDVKSPTPKAENGILALGGNPNIWSLTIENEGFTGEVVPQAQLDAIVWQVEQWQTRYGIPDENVIRHADINQIDKEFCPGEVLYNRVMRTISGREPGPEDRTEPCTPVPPPPFDGSDKTISGKVFHADARTVTVAVDELNCRRFADPDSCITRAPLRKDQTFRAIYWVEGEEVDGEKRWWVTKRGSRIWAGGTVQKPH